MISSYTFFFRLLFLFFFLIDFLMLCKHLIGEKTLNCYFCVLKDELQQLVKTQVTFELLEELKCSLCYIMPIMKSP